MWHVLLKCFSIFPVSTCGKQPKFHKYSPLILYVLGYRNKHNSSLPGFNPGIISVQFSQNRAKTTSAFAFIPNDKYNVKKNLRHISPPPPMKRKSHLYSTLTKIYVPDSIMVLEEKKTKARKCKSSKFPPSQKDKFES